MTTTIGADPELFVTDEHGIIPAVGMIGGTKEQPLPCKCGALQEDNVLAEFNIDPCQTAEDFYEKVTTVMGCLRAAVINHTPGTSLVVQSSHDFDIDTLFMAGEQALRFGCDPDLNCWTGEMNPAPDGMATLRTAGGHVHIGYDNPDPATSFLVAKMCDYLLGVPSVILDGDKLRRGMYGQAGACRIKAYGVEYRSLSNFWLQSRDYCDWVFTQAKRAIEDLDSLDYLISKVPPNRVQKCINTSNEKTAKSIIKTLDLELPEFN